MGVRGQIEMWDSSRSYPRTRGDIAKLARLTVKGNVSPRLVSWMPFPESRERPKTADQGSGVYECPNTKSAAGERGVSHA
jgi:hypothetical protein